MKAKRSITGIVSLVIVIGIVAAAMIISEASDATNNELPGASNAGTAADVSAPAEQPSSPAASDTPIASDTPDAGATASGKITSVPAETGKNTKLEQAIIKEIGFPGKKEIESTRYYYNLVDLNGDGSDEVFVELVGTYTSGTGGDTGLIFTQENGAFKLLQKMTLVRNPVVICDTTTNGWHDISMTLSGGGGASGTVLMKFDGTKYPNPGEAAPAEASDISGTAIISNDVAADLQAGKGLYLTAKDS